MNWIVSLGYELRPMVPVLRVRTQADAVKMVERVRQNPRVRRTSIEQLEDILPYWTGGLKVTA